MSVPDSRRCSPGSSCSPPRSCSSNSNNSQYACSDTQPHQPTPPLQLWRRRREWQSSALTARWAVWRRVRRRLRRVWIGEALPVWWRFSSRTFLLFDALWWTGGVLPSRIDSRPRKASGAQRTPLKRSSNCDGACGQQDSRVVELHAVTQQEAIIAVVILRCP